jgi:uncharacterized glyoxalase superfamily protein PhnB
VSPIQFKPGLNLRFQCIGGSLKILDVTPMLTVTAMGPAIAFYRDVLGFECVSSTDGWATMGSSGVEVMLALPNAHLPFTKPVLTGSLYFNTDDVDAFWERLKDQCEVVYPIEDFAYGMREFAIRDNSGYLLQFGEQIEAERL